LSDSVERALPGDADRDGKRTIGNGHCPTRRRAIDRCLCARPTPTLFAGADFILLDKRQAMLYVFDAEARLRDASPVLLGAARGDASTPGIGTRAIAEVQPHERTTPAGRFVAERGRNTLGEDVVWVDYDAAVSIHRVRATQPSERRLQRLASETIDDNRISYGCINVPVAFYETFVGPTVAQHRTIVYVLPETSPAQQLFGSYDVAARHTFRSDPKKQLSRLQ
jgi:hypothetical protein